MQDLAVKPGCSHARLSLPPPRGLLMFVEKPLKKKKEKHRRRVVNTKGTIPIETAPPAGLVENYIALVACLSLFQVLASLLSF